MKKLLFVILTLSICLPDLQSQPNPVKPGTFRFAFLTDIHMEYNEKTLNSFDNTVKQLNSKKPAFILTGGDNVKDARRQRETYADSVYNLYIDQMKRFNAKVYTGIGNHESFGVSNPRVDPSNPMYGKKMYQSRHGNLYSSFMHKGWKFFMLDNIRDVGATYVGSISGDQMEWLREELASTDPSTPIVIVGHIPFISSMKQFELGSLTPTPPNDGVDNSVEFFKLFAKHNLKLVLQGHFHFMEILYANNCHYIVSPDPRTGFFMFRVKNDEVEWEFVRNE
jgi:3',5'-cyclic-AMP phosphodiesterase